MKALDGKTVKIKGFMFPLDETEDQKHFLFGPFPLNCPFQYHVQSSLVMEVHADICALSHRVPSERRPRTLFTLQRFPRRREVRGGDQSDIVTRRISSVVVTPSRTLPIPAIRRVTIPCLIAAVFNSAVDDP